MALFGAPIAHEDHAARVLRGAFSPGRISAATPNELRLGRRSASRCVWDSTPERSWSERSETICAWTTPRSDTRRASVREMEQIAEAREGLSQRAHREARRRVVTLQDLGKLRRQGREGAGSRLRASGDRKTENTPRGLSCAGFSKFVGRSGEPRCSRERSSGHSRRGQVLASSPIQESARAPLLSNSSSAAGARGFSSTRASCPAHGKTIPYVRFSSSGGSYFGITREIQRRGEKEIAGTLLLLDRTARELARWSSSSSG